MCCGSPSSVEIFFGIINRQAIRCGTFTSVKDLTAAIEAFIEGWNERCAPVAWAKPADEIIRRAVIGMASSASAALVPPWKETNEAISARRPTRLATGAYIAHAGWEKLHGDEQHAKGVHAMASGAFPFVRGIAPTTFLKALAGGEIVTGAALLTPAVPNRLAGAALTGFAGALLAMYLRTPALHKPGSIWPTQAGTGVSKDVWMLGIGVGLLADQ